MQDSFFRHASSRPWGQMSFIHTGGGKPVVFLHSAGRNGLDFTGLFPWLSDARRCLAPDFCGHGQSTLPRQTVTLHTFARDLEDWISEQYLGKCDLVGHGTGGMIALELLKRKPEVVGKVVLLDTFLPESRRLDLFGEDLVPEFNRTRLLQFRQTLARWTMAYWEDFLITARAFTGRNFLAATMRELLFLNADRHRADLPGIPGLGLPQRPNILLHWFPAAGHFFPLDEPDEAGRLLRRYLVEDSTDFDAPPPDDEPEDRPPPTLSELMMNR